MSGSIPQWSQPWGFANIGMPSLQGHWNPHATTGSHFATSSPWNTQGAIPRASNLHQAFSSASPQAMSNQPATSPQGILGAAPQAMLATVPTQQGFGQAPTVQWFPDSGATHHVTNNPTVLVDNIPVSAPE